MSKLHSWNSSNLKRQMFTWNSWELGCRLDVLVQCGDKGMIDRGISAAVTPRTGYEVIVLLLLIRVYSLSRFGART